MSALERAREKGIAVVTYNTTVEGNAPAAFVESDQTALGTSTGVVAREYIATKLGGKASIALLGFQSQTPEQHAARLGGFKSEVLKLPGVKVVAEQDAWLAEQAVKKAGDILTANPDVNIIFAGNEGGTVGAVMAVKNAGKAGKVAVFGVDIGDQIMDLLLAEDAILQAVTGQRPYEIGKLSLEIMLKVLNGEKVEPKVSLPGLLLVRDKPDEVRAFKSRLHELTR
jgi:ABC-type sugar transport system substrate-binding protein